MLTLQTIFSLSLSMRKNTTKLVLIFIIFITSLSSTVSTVAASKVALTEIIITNELEPLKPDIAKTRLRIVDNNGLIIVSKVKAVKVEGSKLTVKDTPKIEQKVVTEEKAEVKKIESQPAPKITPEIDSKKNIKAEAKTENPKSAPAKDLAKNTEAPVKNPEAPLLDESAIPAKKEVLNTQAVQELIRKYALKYNQNPEQMLKLGECESNFKANAVTASTYFGVYQFTKGTFEEYAKELKIENPDPLNPEQNIEVAIYMIQNGQLSRWGCKV